MRPINKRNAVKQRPENLKQDSVTFARIKTAENYQGVNFLQDEASLMQDTREKLRSFLITNAGL